MNPDGSIYEVEYTFRHSPRERLIEAVDEADAVEKFWRWAEDQEDWWPGWGPQKRSIEFHRVTLYEDADDTEVSGNAPVHGAD